MKPSIILVTGSFALPEFYDDVVSAIRLAGYDIQVPHLLTCGQDPGPQSKPPLPMSSDAELIATLTAHLANEGKDVLLVGHSYGGIPMSESTKGLSKVERAAEGKNGGIVGLAYITCLVPPVGGSARTALANLPEENKIEIKVDEVGWLYHASPAQSAAIVYSDLPAAEGEEWVKRYPRHSGPSFGSNLTWAGYKDIPASWLLCGLDLCVPAKGQREAIALIEETSGKKVDVTSIQAPHIPMERHLDAVVAWIVGVAEKY